MKENLYDDLYQEEKEKKSNLYLKTCDLLYYMQKNIKKYPKLKAFIWTLKSRDIVGKQYKIAKKQELEESDKVYYMVIDNEGDIVQEPLLLEQGMLPGYSKPVYYAGYVYFTNSNGTNNLKTYKIRMVLRK